MNPDAVMGARPRLSVVVATTEGWPYVQPVLDAFRVDAEAAGAEVIFSDGSGRPVPSPDEVGPSVTWLVRSSETVFKLFTEGLEAARGDIVATTEDHAIPRPGWIPAILRAHELHPEAAAIGGAIENGSTKSLVQWASYFITQGPHMAPLGDRQAETITNEANVSYKRRAVTELDDNGGLGFMAILHNRRLAERGEILRVDDRIVVDHLETVGWRNTAAIHFHNGRSIAGFRRERGMAPEDWARMLAALILPAVRTARQLRISLGKGRLRREVLSSAPLMLWLDYCGGIGHFVGYAMGPGDSPRGMR